MSQRPFQNEAVFHCLDQFTQKQITKVKQALTNGNPIYAIYVTLAILKHNPRKTELRVALRKTQNAVHPIQHSPLLGLLQSIKAWLRFTPKWAYAYFLFTHNNHDHVIYLCEEILCECPYFYLAHQLQLLASQALQDIPTQILALESMIRLNPRRVDTQLKLAKTYLTNGQFHNAEKLAEHILSQNPTHFEALQTARRAIAARIKTTHVAQTAKDYSSFES